MSIPVHYEFAGTVILVTGGASGIGAAVARYCGEHGATVVALDVSADRLRSIEGGPGIDTRRVDVADSGAVRALIEDLDRRYGRIDAAVLGAAIQARAPIETMSDALWRAHMAVNVDGVFHCLREIMPIMKRQRSGAIVAFTSGLVGMGWPGAAAYAASKGAILGLMKSAAAELRDFGVRANVLSPGLMATPIWLDASDEKERAFYASSIGISSPEAVVPSVLHLISDASAGLTGAVIERRMVGSEDPRATDKN